MLYLNNITPRKDLNFPITMPKDAFICSVANDFENVFNDQMTFLFMLHDVGWRNPVPITLTQLSIP